MAVLFLSTHQLKSSLSFLQVILWLPALRGPPINLPLFSEDYRKDKDKIFLSLCFLCYPVRGKFKEYKSKSKTYPASPNSLTCLL